MLMILAMFLKKGIGEDDIITAKAVKSVINGLRKNIRGSFFTLNIRL